VVLGTMVSCWIERPWFAVWAKTLESGTYEENQ